MGSGQSTHEGRVLGTGQAKSHNRSRRGDVRKIVSVKSKMSDNDPRFVSAKKITVNGIRRLPLAIPGDSKRFGFENEHRSGSPMCWKMAYETASQFAKAGLRDANVIFTKSTEITIYFPAFTRYFAAKSFQSQSGFTLSHILRCIEATSLGAMAYYIKNDLQSTKVKKVTNALVKKLLRLYAMCAINIKGNRVYCITADV